MTTITRMPKFITVGEQLYKIKRFKKDLYAIYQFYAPCGYAFFGYQDKYGIEDAIFKGEW